VTSLQPGKRLLEQRRRLLRDRVERDLVRQHVVGRDAAVLHRVHEERDVLDAALWLLRVLTPATLPTCDSTFGTTTSSGLPRFAVAWSRMAIASRFAAMAARIFRRRQEARGSADWITEPCLLRADRTGRDVTAAGHVERDEILLGVR